MAVGKGSMVRASKGTSKAGADGAKDIQEEALVETSAKEVAKTESGKAVKSNGSVGAKKNRKTAAKPAVSGVVGAASKEVVEKIVYQSSSQMLDRDAKPGETFGIGDAMPVYFF